MCSAQFVFRGEVLFLLVPSWDKCDFFIIFLFLFLGRQSDQKKAILALFFFFFLAFTGRHKCSILIDQTFMDAVILIIIFLLCFFYFL